MSFITKQEVSKSLGTQKFRLSTLHTDGTNAKAQQIGLFNLKVFNTCYKLEYLK